jgi:acyl dehydratase
MLSMGLVAQAVTDWVGVGRVHELSDRFAALVRPGDVIACHGRVLEKRPASPDGRP